MLRWNWERDTWQHVAWYFDDCTFRLSADVRIFVLLFSGQLPAVFIPESRTHTQCVRRLQELLVTSRTDLTTAAAPAPASLSLPTAPPWGAGQVCVSFLSWLSFTPPDSKFCRRCQLSCCHVNISPSTLGHGLLNLTKIIFCSFRISCYDRYSCAAWADCFIWRL